MSMYSVQCDVSPQTLCKFACKCNSIQRRRCPSDAEMSYSIDTLSAILVSIISTMCVSNERAILVRPGDLQSGIIAA